jgi:hypothetical protein
MKAETEEVLSCLVDGEAVDPDALAAALAQPGGVAMLVDLVRVQRAVADDPARPSAAFYESIRPALAPARRARLFGIRMPAAAAAALALACGLGGV